MSFAAYAAKASSLIAAVPRGTAYLHGVPTVFDLAIDDAIAQCSAAEALAISCLLRAGAHTLDSRRGAIDDETERMAALAALAERVAGQA